MRFHIAINLERMDAQTDICAVRDHVLEMVQMADRAGFEIAWAAEHHALEMTIAPNPFQIMTWWADHTESIRLGCGVANAAYWHPINLAGEAAMVDLLSDGRLDLGLGSYASWAWILVSWDVLGMHLGFMGLHDSREGGSGFSGAT